MRAFMQSRERARVCMYVWAITWLTNFPSVSLLPPFICRNLPVAYDCVSHLFAIIVVIIVGVVSDAAQHLHSAMFSPAQEKNRHFNSYSRREPSTFLKRRVFHSLVDSSLIWSALVHRRWLDESVKGINRSLIAWCTRWEPRKTAVSDGVTATVGGPPGQPRCTSD